MPRSTVPSECFPPSSCKGSGSGYSLPLMEGPDMVYPIRSVVGISPASPRDTGGGSRDGVGVDVGPGDGYATARFKHVVTGEGHMVVTGVSGSERLRRCEDEPIHVPGAVQGFGALIAIKEDGDGKLGVKVASENSKQIIGYSPSELFALESFCDVLSVEQVESLYEHLEFVRESIFDPAPSNPDVFLLSITTPGSAEIRLWCAVHVFGKNPGLLICEFELEDDHIYPLFRSTYGGEEEGVFPEDTLHLDSSEKDLRESTQSASRPLRALRYLRKRRGQAAAMEVFNLMSQIQEQLSSAPTLEVFLKVLVGVIKDLTGFHRVMIYQFDEAWNGRVVTELVDPTATKDLYKGLHFPASDIPKQARDLYMINKVRLLYDRDQETARLVCKSHEYLDRPLDMTHSYLRAMSPIHLKYLKNMSVRASMSISLTAFNQLWGLISCHSYGQNGMRVSFPIRKMCRLIGETASRNIERLSYASRLQARKLINTVPTEQNPSGYIVASSDDLLRLFDADFGLLSIRGETKSLGELEHSQEALAILEYLRMRKVTSVFTSQNLSKDLPDLKYEPGFNAIAGLLLVPLSIDGQDLIVFFRKGQLLLVNWAGNPYQKIRGDSEGCLEPRKSFKTWSETVVGTCREWTEEQIETGAVLGLVYGKFIEVWRQKEAAIQTSQLTRLLLANASHEVRTPLNAVINYLEIALESPLDNETRNNLMESHSASKSLVYVINDLLDLTRTEEGRDLFMEEIFNLTEAIRDATERYRSDVKRKNISFDVIEYDGLPEFVKGDRARLRQAVSNITGNAVKHTSEGGIKIELWTSGIAGKHCTIDIAVQDTGVGMSSGKLDTLFREFEQVQAEDGTIGPHNAGAGTPRVPFDALSKIPRQKVLGLGLAVVARVVRNMDGQLRLKSEEGKGSRFTISLPFLIVTDIELDSRRRESECLKSPLPPPHGELLVIDSQNRSSEQATRRSSVASAGSLGSLSSTKSGGSELDRLVHAISAPHLRVSPDEVQTRSSRAMSLSSQPLGVLAPPLWPRQEVIEPAMPLTALRGKDKTNGSLSPGPLEPPQPPAPGGVLRPGPFTILVAEDNPINSKIIQKRLGKIGHIVHLTENGEECVSIFHKQGGRYDLVLMDIQMPVMDGGAATMRIRQLESTITDAPGRYELNTRVPIFAVSATLIEERRAEYVALGFDGWVLKPVDFKRLAAILDGVCDLRARKTTAYRPGFWECGGWFSAAPPPSPMGGG